CMRVFHGAGFVGTFAFFFQAEDGIRGGHVTGVQTCALPILLEPTTVVEKGIHQAYEIQRRLKVWRPRKAAVMGAGTIGLLATMRSEERRVGKECRSRWLAYQ